MKKINYFYVALLSIILVAPSCSKDDEVSPSNNEGGKVVVDSTYSSLTATFTSLSTQIGIDKYLFKINDTTIVVKTYFEKTNEKITHDECAYSAGYVEKYGFHNDLVYATMNAKKIIVHYDIYYKNGTILTDTIIKSVSDIKINYTNCNRAGSCDFINADTGYYPYDKYLSYSFYEGFYNYFY